MNIEEDDEGLDDSEFPNEDDADDESDTIPCPNCRRSIYQYAERCPRCGTYIYEEAAPRRVPVWIVVGAVVCTVVVVWWVLGRG